MSQNGCCHRSRYLTDCEIASTSCHLRGLLTTDGLVPAHNSSTNLDEHIAECFHGLKTLSPSLRGWGISTMNDLTGNKGQVSLLVEHSQGVYEITVLDQAISPASGFSVMLLKPVSGSNHSIPSHSTIANALQMQRWMLAHPLVFLEGLTTQ